MAQHSSIDVGKTALVAMDFQRRQLSAFSEEFQRDIIARASGVRAKARQKGMFVINVEVVRGERTPETEIHPDMRPQAGEPLLTKRRVGPFSTTNLDELLKSHNIETLVLMGIRTMGCVLSTVRWAADIDYKVIVLADCCADQDQEVHRVLMEKVFPFTQASVINSDEFLRAMG